MTQPTAHYRQHHDVEEPRIDGRAFRPAWRRRDHLDTLEKRGLINLKEWHAAFGFRITYETAHFGAWRTSDPAAVHAGKHCRRRSAAELSERQANALGWLRALEPPLGALFPLLELAVVEQLSWHELGRWLTVDPKTARAWTVTAIKALAVLLERYQKFA
jgi:hypothetical protein